MSLYELQRHLFDRLNLHDADGRRTPMAAYDMTVEEVEVVAQADLARMHHRGVHPVLIQAFGRLFGLGTDDIVRQLRALPAPEERRVPWRSST